MNSTAVKIKNIYKSIGINDPQQLSIENVVNQFDLRVYYWKHTSELVEYKGEYSLFINENLNDQGQWQDFGHEMKHYFFDRGNQTNLTDLFIGYQETKADYFAYHFCVPTFMLEKLRGVTVHDVMNIFNVEFDFALRRLEMYKSKLLMVAENKTQYMMNR